MTKRECAIVMAYTGVCMLAGEDFGIFHKYVEQVMGAPVYTHELAFEEVQDENQAPCAARLPAVVRDGDGLII